MGKISINKKKECKAIFEEFNSVISELLDIMSDKRIYGKNYQDILNLEYIALEEREDDYRNLLDIILNLLEEKTNINDILERKKYSLKIPYIQNALRKLLNNKENTEFYESFLNNLNEEFKSSKSHFTFLIPLNLNFSPETFEKFKNNLKIVLSQFNLSEYDPNKADEFIKDVKPLKLKDEDKTELKIANKSILNNLKEFPEVLKFDFDAPDLNYARKKAIFAVESFLGYISYVTEKYSKKFYFGRQDFRDFSLYNPQYGILFTVKDNMLEPPINPEIGAIKDGIGKRRIDIKNVEELVKICSNYICKIKNDSLKNILFKSFSLYYSACNERNLDYSFLKFWVLSEQMIKSSGRPKTDPEVLKIMKNFVEPINNYLPERVEFLYKKRNGIVHKGETGKISDNDRNLAKLIADIFIEDAITEMKNLDNKRQYDIYISNFKAKK